MCDRWWPPGLRSTTTGAGLFVRIGRAVAVDEDPIHASAAVAKRAADQSLQFEGPQVPVDAGVPMGGPAVQHEVPITMTLHHFQAGTQSGALAQLGTGIAAALDFPRHPSGESGSGQRRRAPPQFSNQFVAQQDRVGCGHRCAVTDAPPGWSDQRARRPGLRRRRNSFERLGISSAKPCATLPFLPLSCRRYLPRPSASSGTSAANVITSDLELVARHVLEVTPDIWGAGIAVDRANELH